MHFVTCEHPKKCHNRYTDSDMLVPCGTCDICLSLRSASWVNRIELERMSHPYSVFFTLTYTEHTVPKCVVDGESLVNLQTGEVLSFASLMFDKPFMANSKNYVLRRGWLCVPHVPYLQNFIKRLRSKVDYYENNPNAKRVRYFIATEYGPTTHRIHHHGVLFFESKWLAENAKEVIASCWSTDNRAESSRSLGRTDVQFIEGNASSYVAQYLNCTSHLPYIYKTKEFRPTALFSRCPSIGSLLCDSEEIRKIFDSGSSRFNCYNRATKEYNVRPLPPSLENRLYPKVKYFSQIPHSLRVGLYRFISAAKPAIFSYVDFKERLLRYFPEYYVKEAFLDENGDPENGKESSFLNATNNFERETLSSDLHDYFTKVFFNYDVPFRLLEIRRRRLFSALMRFEYQRYIFKLSVDDYLDRIERYYDTKEQERLKEQFESENECSKSDSLINTMFVDSLFVQGIKERGYVTESEQLILSSYGWNCDEMSYTEFLDNVQLEKYSDFVTLRSKSRCLCDKNRKTKVKNEYVSAHMSNSLINAIYGK